MLAIQLRAAVDAACSDSHLVELSQALWRGLAAGAINDEEAQAISEIVHARRVALRGPQTAHQSRSGRSPGRPSIFPPKRPQRSPDRARSLQRRRTLAASGPLPPALANRFTTGELAALKIVADEVHARGACELCVGAISARAGVSASTARNAVRTARCLGLLTVEERRRRGQRNDTNRITIVDAGWLAWISKGSRVAGGGFKKLNPTDKILQNNENPCAKGNRRKSYREGSDGSRSALSAERSSGTRRR